MPQTQHQAKLTRVLYLTTSITLGLSVHLSKHLAHKEIDRTEVMEMEMEVLAR